jgi:very-short-patch-repair endonuclease
MTSDKLQQSQKKSRQKSNSAKLIDVFTTICKTDLRVECVKEFKFHPVRKWRFDYAIPEHKIALEVEGGVWTGGRHTSSVGFMKDMEKYNTATLMGWRVFRTTPDELYRLKTLNLLKTAISGVFDPEKA